MDWKQDAVNKVGQAEREHLTTLIIVAIRVGYLGKMIFIQKYGGKLCSTPSHYNF